ncbi:protein kinase domain-containing protein, partial [Cardiosporidium cionae]
PGKEKALNVSTRGGTKDVHVAHSRKSVEKTASFFEKHQNEDNSANSNAQKYAVIKFSPEMVSSAWKGNPNSNFVQSDTPVTPTPYEGSKLLGSKMHKKNFADEGNEQEGIPPCLYQQMPLPYAPPPDFLCSEPSVFTQTPMVAYWPNGSSTGVSVTPVGASDKERNGVESRAFPRDPTGTMAMAAVPLFRGNPSHSTMRSPPFYIMRPYPPSGGVEKEEASNGGPPALIGASSLMDWHHPSGNHAMTRPAAPPAAPVIQGAPYTKGAMPLQVSLPAGNPMGVFHPSPFCKSSTSAQGGKMPFLPSEEGLSLFEPTIRSLGGKDAPAELPPSLSIPHPAGSREVHRGVPTLPCSPSTSQRPSSLLPTSFRKPQRNDVNKLSTAGLSSGRLVSSRMRPKEETKEASGSWMRSKESESNDVPSLEATPPQKSPGELPALIFSRPAGPVLSPLYEETRAGNVDELVELGGEPSTASSSPIPLKLIKDPPGSSILETRKQSRTSDDFRGPVGYSLGRKRAPARPADGSANGIVGAEGDPPSKNPPPEGIFDLLPMGRSMTPSPLLSSPSLTKETPEVFGLPSKLPLPSGASRSNRLCSPQPSRVRSFSAEGDNLNGNCVPAKTSSPVIVSKAPPYGVGGPAGGLRGRPPADIPTLIPPLAGMAGNSLSVAGSSPPGQQLSPPPAGGRAMSPLPPILSQRNPAQATIPQFKNSHPTPVHVGAPPLLNGVGNLPIPLNHPDNAPLTLRESQLKRAPAELGLGMNNALLASLEIDPAEVKVTFEVGVGATSVVFKGLWRGTDVALKRLKVNVSEDNTREFLKELAIMTRLRHPNLVLLMGIISQTAPYYVVTEFCAGGTLFDILHKYRINLTWSQRIKIAGDIAKGCTYLHASQPQILHRDLKSLNILLAEPIAGVNVPLAKVSDFGMSKIRQQADIKNMTGMAGTFQWMAPEVLHNRPYDEKVDIYSYGIVLYELITSRVPYEECHHSSAVTTAIAVAQGLRPDLRRIPNECPRTLRSLMVACWDSRPQKRPTFSQIVDILKHPCLDGKI